MKTNTCAALFSLALLGAGSVLAQTATTKPVGFSSTAGSTGSRLIVPSLVNADTFVGTALFNSATNTITPTTSPSWTPAAYNETAFVDGRPNYPTYYVEVQTGALEGLVIDVVSNSGTAVTVPSGDIPAALDGQTISIALRQHMTLDKIAEGSTGLVDYTDSVNLSLPNGNVETRYFTGTNVPGTKWVAGDFATPAGHSIVYPGSGFILNGGSAASFTFVGSVKTTKTIVPIYANVVNVVGPPNPTTSMLLLQTNLVGPLGTNNPYGDLINNIAADGSMNVLGTYYSDGSNLLNGSFAPLAPAATDSISGNNGVIYSSSSDTTWTIPSIYTGS